MEKIEKKLKQVETQLDRAWEKVRELGCLENAVELEKTTKHIIELDAKRVMLEVMMSN